MDRANILEAQGLPYRFRDYQTLRTVDEVEVVAFDEGQEYSGGVYPLQAEGYGGPGMSDTNRSETW